VAIGTILALIDTLASEDKQDSSSKLGFSRAVIALNYLKRLLSTNITALEGENIYHLVSNFANLFNRRRHECSYSYHQRFRQSTPSIGLVSAHPRYCFFYRAVATLPRSETVSFGKVIARRINVPETPAAGPAFYSGSIAHCAKPSKICFAGM